MLERAAFSSINFFSAFPSHTRHDNVFSARKMRRSCLNQRVHYRKGCYILPGMIKKLNSKKLYVTLSYAAFLMIGANDGAFRYSSPQHQRAVSC